MYIHEPHTCLIVYDVVVVGAGPCGSAAARSCAESGLSTLCIEEHAAIGHPVQCAGLLSCQAFRECGVSERSVQNRVRGARICYGGGASLAFDAGTTRAFVVDRGVMDREMARIAADRGAEFALKTYACAIRGSTLTVKERGERREIPFRILIAADGPRSTIARLLGMERPRLHLSGLQCEMPCDLDPNLVEIHPHASPDFFGWAIPVRDGRARVGLCGLRDVRERFQRFAARFGHSSLALVSGVIPLGTMPRTFGNRVLFVGDAAGFPKPTSGGGIYTGVRSARHAARVAAECCESGRFDDDALRSYESAWKKDFGHELEVGMRLLSLRRRMSDGELDGILARLNDPGILAAIVQYGDMDRPSRLLRQLAGRPGLIRILGTLFRAGVRADPH
ncbi:MAG: NAD(P)/FAD-dependent oxidoreductase [Methanomicrobiales archaeon]|nr:NAD(P)/FAD-dependent oxidoreductase [Methanomicrobiales archaeon]MDI6877276.1 NAD(P)/FAD-dependent oxidoreductase [Methanomicrobiales archaeon]